MADDRPDRTYPHGVPCWIDTEQPDPAAARAFYGELFGWTFEEAMPPGAPGSYLIARLDGHDAAALAPAAGSTASWNTYVAVEDADRTAALVVEGGGTVVAAPQDAGPAGRSVTFTDPAGAELRLWQPGRRLGAQVTNVAAAWNFSDLHTPDPTAAVGFHAALFGWEVDELDLGGAVPARMVRRPGYGTHLAATVDPDILARQDGISAPPGFADAVAWFAPTEPGEAPHWHVTFTVADRDDAMARALRLGATDRSGPVDTDWTRAVVVTDPQGATFTMSQFTPPEG